MDEEEFRTMATYDAFCTRAFDAYVNWLATRTYAEIKAIKAAALEQYGDIRDITHASPKSARATKATDLRLAACSRYQLDIKRTNLACNRITRWEARLI